MLYDVISLALVKISIIYSIVNSCCDEMKNTSLHFDLQLDWQFSCFMQILIKFKF